MILSKQCIDIVPLFILFSLDLNAFSKYCLNHFVVGGGMISKSVLVSLGMGHRLNYY